jgi:hypothetical protein
MTSEYRLIIQTEHQRWPTAFNSSIDQPQRAITGLQVSLDAADADAPLYEVVSNGYHALVVNSSSDLSAMVGKELIGVHQLQTLTLGQGTSLSYGADRLIIHDMANSTFNGDLIADLAAPVTDIIAILAQSPTASFTVYHDVNFDQLTMSGGGLTVKGTMSITNQLDLNTGASLQVDSLVVGDMVVDDSTLSAQSIISAANVQLTNGTTFTAPAANLVDAQVYGLALTAAGQLTIDATSQIDLNGKGYPGDRHSGPDFSFDTSTGCHGGSRYGSYNCSYGDYRHAQYGGSGGLFSNSTAASAAGGGYININVAGLTVDGDIEASGIYGKWGGAGGGIHIVADHVNGTGSVEVFGSTSDSNYWTGDMSGGGGRISIISADTSGFSGRLTAESRGNNPSGAGSIYIQDPAKTYGHLIIDNGSDGKRSIDSGTPLPHANREVIQTVTNLGDNQWQIGIDRSAWKPSSEYAGSGLLGLEVSLDAANLDAPLYKVIANDADNFTVVTNDDLSGHVGLELIGVHTFETLNVILGGALYLGSDRLQVLDGANSQISGKVTAQITTQFFDHSNVISSGVKYTIKGDTTVADLTIDGGGLTIDGNLTVTNSLTLNGGVLTIKGDLNATNSLNLNDSPVLTVNNLVAADIQASGATITAHAVNVSGNVALLSGSVLTTDDATLEPNVIYKLMVNIAGLLSIDASSTIDLSGKGYPAHYFGGPDFSKYITAGCHGGQRTLSTEVCSYGDYRHAQYAGGAGYKHNTQNDGSGGGVVDIQAGSIILDGAIKANGNGNGFTYAGAGGGIHIVTASLTGSGSIAAIGGNSAHSGAGGRISLMSADTALYSGSLLVNAGSSTGEFSSGAGTAFIQDPNDQYGYLLIDNGNNPSFEHGTVIPHANRHIITAVESLADQQWRITIGSEGWVASTEYAGSGILGVQISLDAADLAAPLYTILSNTTDSLVISSALDLSAVVGNELIGVHRFTALDILNGASVDFGEDRVETVDGTPIVLASLQQVKRQQYQQQHQQQQQLQFDQLDTLWATINRRYLGRKRKTRYKARQRDWPTGTTAGKTEHHAHLADRHHLNNRWRYSSSKQRHV